MKLKFNWGTGIALTYILFLIAILTMVFIFMNQDVALETNDYYAKGLEYQSQIDKIERTKNLTEQLEILNKNDQIVFNFPKIFANKIISGEIYFYRPSNNKSDFKSKIDLTDSLQQIIFTKNLEKGLWKIKVDWSVENQNYYNEKILMIN
ncbi:FixH family protein [Stygiobacter electus]|uniref:FixH family protein n=1 Tax=Stygiobacter electus TaxID=3032292 RepID=A0AAE3TD75_9BACT|nr:FixH family protein [Stygiobacter electus]MDF1612241.1 FixH family protein [Stygiobacter electus]